MSGEFESRGGMRLLAERELTGRADQTIKKIPVRKRLVIILDPGHGVKGGNVGAQARIYKHKVMGGDGNPVLNDKGVPLIHQSSIDEIPHYVMSNPESWVVGNNSSAQNKYDNERTEYRLTFDIAKAMANILSGRGYSVFITRDSREVVSIDAESDLARRVKFSNEKGADYFLSIHADGMVDFSTGSHAIYSSGHDVEANRELAQDVMSLYDVVAVDRLSPREDIRNIYVLSAANKARRSTLVEVGFVTSPKDSNALFSQVDLVARQLVDGLEVNIKRNFTE